MTTLAYPDTPDRRLRRALRVLDEALALQREAVGALRSELGALGRAVSGLGRSTMALDDALSAAAEDAARADLAAREIGRSAELLERVARR